MPWYEWLILLVLIIVMIICAKEWWQDSNLKKSWSATSSKNASGLQHKLRLLDINLAPISVILGIISLSVCTYVAINYAFPKQQGIAIIMALAIMLSSYFLLDDLVTWRTKKVETELVDAMDTMHSSLQAGLSPLQAISTAANLAKGVLKSELTEVVTRLSSGYDASQAVHRLVSRYNTEGTRLFAQALVARHQTGSDFSAMLQAVSQLMRQRIEQYQYINSQMSATRYAAIFCGLMPYALIPLFISQEQQWFTPLLEHPNGANFLSTALFLQIVGFFWLRKVLKANV
ncbi:type II secretion system F family protein [Shewanella ulleungensis]|uniref:Type II secretion system protein GspF domain-containing protein n=1 Tax=Shewanella ulleungensis TaxID=2282699 RepID=A0ABQ2QCP3_9GAMM|nr:type II secretion system F family protein [Shewanella ulleungensis]MCL1148742.1 type II secretion system F family protein [Shewanella ulleungensis]GGP75901.1 hypothetical protein GCM10009410_05210 [Shewanella ulleungensis]